MSVRLVRAVRIEVKGDPKGRPKDRSASETLDRMTRPDAEIARAANCGPVNCAWADGRFSEPVENTKKMARVVA